MFRREIVVGQRAGDSVGENLHRFGESAAPCLSQRFDFSERGLAALLRVNRFERRCKRAFVAVRHFCQHVAVEVHRASLPARLGKHLSKSLHKPQTGVGHRKLYSAQPAFFKMP